ncbi:hypothetical protein TNCV_4204591 [Trichonephila clavipes]|nr:hypothetical protein TNCV_4204591 [Trichonephila clavipes]
MLTVSKNRKKSPPRTLKTITPLLSIAYIVRPNIPYAQATNNSTSNSNPQQQMAPPVKAIPATKTQTQASRATPP